MNELKANISLIEDSVSYYFITKDNGDYYLEIVCKIGGDSRFKLSQQLSKTERECA